MKKLYVITVVMVLAFATVSIAYAGGSGRHFVANLSGGSEVPSFDTKARGQAVLKLNRRGELSYKLIVNADNIVASHIHCAPADANGPVGVTLFFGAPASNNGILAQGPILAPDAGNGCGWLDLDDVVDAMRSGDTYVNVHTLTILSGEIRGQVR